MNENNLIFYYEVDYYPFGTDDCILELCSDYGFIYAEDYATAARKLAEYYSTELINMKLEAISDNGVMLCVNDRAIALSFKKCFENEY